MNKKLYRIFMKTGKIDDFLKYRMELAKEKEKRNEDNKDRRDNSKKS